MNKLLLVGVLLLATASGFSMDPPKPADDIEQVQKTYEQSLVTNPQDKSALFMLGLIYEKKGAKQKALEMWKRYGAAETDPARRGVADKHIHLLSQ